MVGPEAAEAKLVYAKACQKFDFVTTREEDLQKLKSTLSEEGAEIEDITGDMGTNAVVVLAHKEVILECDLGSNSIATFSFSLSFKIALALRYSFLTEKIEHTIVFF